MNRLVRYICAGASGFLVDAAVLMVLVHGFGIGPLPARVVAVAVAMTFTWILNRTVTFAPSGRSLASEGARYGGVGIAASVLNYAVYSAVLLSAPGTPALVALVIGSAAAMGFSYLGYSRLVFRR